MKYYNKTAALALCLTILLSAAVPTATAFAEGESSGVSDTTEAADSETTEASDESAEITSGDFKYIVDDDGNAHITACSSTAEELDIPESLDGVPVTEIDINAFMNCKPKKIAIHANIVYISAENPFAPCLTLEEITVDENSEYFASVDGVLYSKDMKTLMHYPSSKKGDSFAIPEGVETVGTAAISDTPLKEIIIPDSVNTLNRHCFSFNSNLTSIDMSGTSIAEIPVMAFVNCDNLTEVVFPDSAMSIGLAAFMNCKSLAEVTLPEQLYTIDQNAFMGTAMKTAVIPDSVQSIGYSAFGYDENENTVDGFTIVGAANSAAARYAKDTDDEYDYYNNFTFIERSAYERQLEHEALNAKQSGDFEYAVIDGEGYLTACTSMDGTVEVPSEIDGVTITAIYYGAFLSCGSKNIILPETVKTIGEGAFSEYAENITIPGGCTLIEGDEPFLRCHSLKSITVTDGDGEYSSQDGVLYNKDKSLLIAYPQACENTEFTVPDTVKEIAPSAFCYNDKIQKVEMTAVETIGDYAFEGCAALAEAKLPKSLKKVGQNAFLGCSAMKSIRVYDKVEYIGSYAFGYDYDEQLAMEIQNSGDETSGEMPYSVTEGFKMYVEKDSLAMQYATDCGIETVTDTVAVGEKNVDKTFLYVVLGALAAIILAIVGIVTGKTISKKKKAKAAAERKAKAAEKAREDKEEKADEA